MGIMAATPSWPAPAGHRASASMFCQGGASPPQVNLPSLKPEVTACVARPRGEQPEANEQSVGDELDSADLSGEPAMEWRSPDPPHGGKPMTLMRRWQSDPGSGEVVGDGEPGRRDI
jgi:hypothetical protein